jgi:hypothetical protein
MTLHLIKLCVGAESIDNLADWIEASSPKSIGSIVET